MIIIASLLVTLLWVAIGITALALIGIILLQESKSGGLSTAFGAAGGDALLGARGQKDLAKITVFLAVMILILSVASTQLDKGGGLDIPNDPKPASVSAPGDGSGDANNDKSTAAPAGMGAGTNVPPDGNNPQTPPTENKPAGSGGG